MLDASPQDFYFSTSEEEEKFRLLLEFGAFKGGDYCQNAGGV
jgi:hypothetical protein